MNKQIKCYCGHTITCECGPLPKQSSIEWLVKELNQVLDYIPMNKWDAIADIIQQSKQMHKEEIIDAYDKGEFNQGCNGEAKEYYQETYGGNNE